MSRKFFRNAAVMMVGTGLAQAVPILVSPILTRLYSPQEYGLLAAFTGAATIMVVLATLRYELAIVLPEFDDEARAITGLVGLLMLGVCFVYALLMSGVAEYIAVFVGRTGQVEWLYALIPMVVLLGGFQVTSYIATREYGFRLIATAGIVQQLIFAFVAILVGYFSVVGNGLILSRLSGQLGALLILLPAACLWYRSGSRLEIPVVARRYRQFPIFNFPYSLIGTLGRESFVLSLTAIGQFGAAGYYGLARSVVFIPCGFLSSSLSNVFYKEATISLHTDALSGLAARLSGVIALIFTPAFVVLPVISPGLFAWVFGEEWRPAGWYAAWLAPPAYLFLFSSWPERIFEVAERQSVSFTIQAVFDSINIGIIILLLWLGVEPVLIMPVLALVTCCYHFSYLFAAFKIAKFRWIDFRVVVVRAGILCLIWVLVAISVRQLLVSDGDVILTMVLLLAGYYIFIGVTYGRKILLQLRGSE